MLRLCWHLYGLFGMLFGWQLNYAQHTPNLFYVRWQVTVQRFIFIRHCTEYQIYNKCLESVSDRLKKKDYSVKTFITRKNLFIIGSESLFSNQKAIYLQLATFNFLNIHLEPMSLIYPAFSFSYIYFWKLDNIF